MRYGDPAYIDNATRLSEYALTGEAAVKRFNHIRDNRTLPTFAYNPDHFDVMTDRGTSHLNAVDDDGLVIAMTTTINGYWGSKVMTEDGILLNNDMDDFSLPHKSNQFGYVPSPANFIRPGKRPLSSMSPAMVENLDSGRVELAAGSAGGSRIITANLRMLYEYLASGGATPVQHIINRPRWHNQLQPSVTTFESPTQRLPQFAGFDNATVAKLATLGHIPVWVPPGLSAAQAIFRDDSVWKTASELRQAEALGAAI